MIGFALIHGPHPLALPPPRDRLSPFEGEGEFEWINLHLLQMIIMVHYISPVVIVII